ncbi:hypothetical protein ACWCPS_33415 [Streptomyces mauvecolor]
MDTSISVVALALSLCALTGALSGRITSRPFYTLLTVAFLLLVIRDIHRGAQFPAITDAAFTGFFAWRWWQNGGGDDTKRRLRALTRRFKPVRRAAPTTS